MLKRIIHILLFIGALTGLATPAISQQTQPVLTSFDFTIVGVGIGVSPEYQAVPKGINSQVLTALSVGGADVAEIIKLLPQDYTVRAELRGPAFDSLPKGRVDLVTKPGQPFDLPTLAILGKYTLNNIRLCDGSGNTILGAVPQAVAIDSIPDPIVTSVTTRPLSLAELQQFGVTFDSSNFTAYEFHGRYRHLERPGADHPAGDDPEFPAARESRGHPADRPDRHRASGGPGPSA